jgi:hypothetical protein
MINNNLRIESKELTLFRNITLFCFLIGISVSEDTAASLQSERSSKVFLISY